MNTSDIQACSRRHFLGKAAVVGVAGASLALAGCRNSDTDGKTTQPETTHAPSSDSHNKNCFAEKQYDFYGEHQSGITTPAQRHIYFLVLDLHTDSVEEVKTVFKNWTAAAHNLMQGKNITAYGDNPHVPPTDTGEADSLGAYGLTLTFGVSPSFFAKLGLTDKQPTELSELPLFPRDQIRPELSGGDICIQACSDDPQVAFHAVRQLVRQARSSVTMKWSQAGFNSFDSADDTPRNLFGFKDGTANQETLKDSDKHLWANANNPKSAWLKGGTYLVARVIQMHLETWDRTSLNGQEETFGRHRDTGASFGKTEEFEQFDLNAKDEQGKLVIPEISHMGLSKRSGLQILRRSFSYSSGIDSRTGQFNAGLLFISFQKSPMQFTAIQSALGRVDKMNEYITHIGSGLFVCFGGVKQGEYLGQALFES